MIGVLFLVVFVCCFVCLPEDCFEQKNRFSKIEESSFPSEQKLKSSKCNFLLEFCWSKAINPNHPSIYAYLQEYDDLIGTWRTTQKNSTTTRNTWLWSWLIN